MPMSRAAAVVKILKIDPAPSPTRENGCGRMVSPASRSSPYLRLLAMANTLCASLPGLITLITLEIPARFGLAYLSMAALTGACTSGSRVVRIRYPPVATCSLLIPARDRYSWT
ncbi:Uncharacterised protein [Mycobacterium tuberculosis]|nr:Uncharacterised protein [Mycobacterium tuberculosis]